MDKQPPPTLSPREDENGVAENLKQALWYAAAIC